MIIKVEAKVDSVGTEVHEATEFKKGQVFDVLTEPVDEGTLIAFMQLAQRDLLDKASVVDFGDGAIVFMHEEVPGVSAWLLQDYFDIKEEI